MYPDLDITYMGIQIYITNKYIIREKRELYNLEIKRGLRDMSINHDMEISHKFLFTQILEMYIKIFTYKI